MSARIICIWGSPGSGKSTTALALAAVLAEKKLNVAVFNGDKLVPALKMYCPTLQIDSNTSIGPLLMSGRYDDAIFAGRLIVHPKCEYISFLGMAPTDTYITYNEFERSNTVAMLNKMAKLNDYVIIDGTSNPLDDSMTLLGLELGDVIIRQITADNKGILYQDCARMIYREDKYRYDSHITILGDVTEISPVSEVMSVSGRYEYVLNHANEVADKFIAGELLKDMRSMAGRAFEKQIRALAKQVEGKNG